MAQDTVSNFYVEMYKENVRLTASQTRSRLESICEIIPNEQAERGYYDTLGIASSRKITQRFAQVQFQSLAHGRRKVFKEEYSIEIPVAERDIESILADPKSKYIQRGVEEMNRRKDRVILAAALAPVYTGDAGQTLLTAAADGVLTVNATAGLTYAKIQEANTNFIDNEVGNETPVRKILPIAGDEHQAIMNITNFISGDFTRNKPVDDGYVDQVSGIDLIKFGANANNSNPIIPVVGGVRNSAVIAQGGVGLWVSRDISVEVEKRTDLIKTWQIIITMVLGAVRTEGVYVQAFNTTD